MSEPAVTNLNPIAATPRRRGWLILTTVGCVLVLLALLVIGLVLIDKPRFGEMVGPAFLPIITSGVMTGAILMLVGVWNLPERKSWRGRTLIIWALVSVTSPALGLMAIAPLGLVALTSPLTIAILIGLFRR
jgi:drug/metabolite transporter (DMT)-like permease